MNPNLEHDIDARIHDFLQEKWDELGNGMISQVIMVASYIDEDGDERWSAHTMGNGTISGSVGLLEYAKRWLIDSMLAQSGADPEEFL